MNKRTITVRVNGAEHTGETEPRKLLSDFIRDDLGLTGTPRGLRAWRVRRLHRAP